MRFLEINCKISSDAVRPIFPKCET